ncbi:nitronate monooxygenase [Chryseobacterium culicis]|uniref:Propionate 3-nitronate monooxygenase n=1 Tax=Chryseobacterium culicis TaxID=680127 RepID=A0A2S9CZ71_CHRCI|nr:nitronate monooxygenase [Chryseobacterium culicis]PRB85813.1 2-nitropropane dioxygenase [Chryseobacterium culicis]PRB90463.1 2-nitropropane dioxygenase [Chryseobacterium culicis]
MWNKNRITELLGIEYPILQGPFGGGLSTVALTTTVSNLGGLGGFGAYTLSPQEIYDIHKAIEAKTDQPYNLNLWVNDHDIIDEEHTKEQYQKAVETFKPYFDLLNMDIPEAPPTFESRFQNQLEVVLDIKPKVFSFMFGLLDENIIEELHRQGTVVLGNATTLDEAIALEKTGVDAIVASGFESGGHRPSFLDQAELSTTGTFALIQLIKDRVKIPVVAAGGIANGRGIAGAFKLGADAVQIGTAFLATEESGALPIHKQFLFSDAAKSTTLSRAYTGRLGRGITTKITRDVLTATDKTLPFPLQTHFMGALRKAALEQQKNDLVFFWSGQIAPLLKHKKASTLMQSLIEEASELLQ